MKEFYFLPSPYRIKRKENIKRHLWFFIQKYFVNTSPKCFSKYRIFILKLFGAQIGKGCYIASSTYIFTLLSSNLPAIEGRNILLASITRASISHKSTFLTEGCFKTSLTVPPSPPPITRTFSGFL